MMIKLFCQSIKLAFFLVALLVLVCLKIILTNNVLHYTKLCVQVLTEEDNDNIARTAVTRLG